MIITLTKKKLVVLEFTFHSAFHLQLEMPPIGGRFDIDYINNDTIKDVMKSDIIEKKKYKLEIVWRNIFVLSVLHLSGFYGLYLIISGQVIWKTILLCIYFTI